MISIAALQAKLHRVANISDLASKAGLSRKTVYRIRDGLHSPTVRTVEQLETALKKVALQPERQAEAAA